MTFAAIRRLTIDRWNVADASVVRYTAGRPGHGLRGIVKGMYSDLEGEWYALGVKRLAGDSWEVVARRRTLVELAILIESRPSVAA